MGCWVDGSISGMARELKRRCKGAERAGARSSERAGARSSERVGARSSERAGARSLERICGMAMMLEGHRA